jgi:hypothetical protein
VLLLRADAEAAQGQQPLALAPWDVAALCIMNKALFGSD